VGTIWVSRYQKGKTRKVNPISSGFTGGRNSEWQWHQLGHMQICTSPQTDNHASTPPLSSLQAGCPSCRPTNSVKALSQVTVEYIHSNGIYQYITTTQILEQVIKIIDSRLYPAPVPHSDELDQTLHYAIFMSVWQLLNTNRHTATAYSGSLDSHNH